MNLLNFFKKERNLTPQWTTTYPPNRNPDEVKRITPTKEKVITPATITGVKHTVIPQNRPTINDWAKEVRFSIDYEKIQYEQFKQHLLDKSEQLIMNKQYQEKFGPESKEIPLKIRIFNFLNRHL